ncbi:MAG: hypothetical protein DI535_00840 [Citrobacter freundii]|nr:MAG: hypothetical protein DI535_00840 [Citrobacter freundii]
MKIVSAILLLITVFLNLKHGWEGLHIEAHPEQAKMFADMGITKNLIWILSILNIITGIAILFPQTFFIANVLNAVTILLIMIFSIKTGNTKTALTEIPFLLIPLVLIYLGHPLKK